MMGRIIIAAALIIFPLALPATTIRIQNADNVNLGFNDPTPAIPIGGNPGTTLGEQRLNAFRHAASIWEKLIDSPVEIQIYATFAPIRDSGPCTATSAILGAAGAWEKVADFENAPQSGVVYPIALANKFAGRDLRLGEPDIQAFFNADVDSPTCLGERDWYYGLDGNNGADVDLVVVLLHELAHGLGMSGNLNLGSGQFSGNLPSIFEMHTVDVASGLRFDQMTPQQRRAAVISGSQIAWDGPLTREAAAGALNITTALRITTPDPLAGTYEINPAAFGPRVDQIPTAGRIVAAIDAADDAGPLTTDGCSTYSNPADLAGRVVLVDRGTCTFVEKTLRAQAAGAIGLIVVNNEICGLPPMGGASNDVRIPAIGISKTDGDAIRLQLAAGVDGSLRLDPSTRSGATPLGFVRLYAPCELEQGSSMYHWDMSTTPNLLMEPFINEDLPHDVDITLHQLLDIGWTRFVNSPSGRRILRR